MLQNGRPHLNHQQRSRAGYGTHDELAENSTVYKQILASQEVYMNPLHRFLIDSKSQWGWLALLILALITAAMFEGISPVLSARS